MERQKYRTVENVFEDGLWPPQGLIPDPLESVRHQAIAEVLCCIPPNDYERLTDSSVFQWFIPHEREYGVTYPFHAMVNPEPDPQTGLQRLPYCPVLYLSPGLERRAYPFVLAVVAHEFAHLVLAHDLFPATIEKYDAQENEAWEAVCGWGFEREAKEHHRYIKWRDSWEEYQIRRLREKSGQVR